VSFKTLDKVVEEIRSAPAKNRAALLKKYENPALIAILRMNFDPRIVIRIPEGSMPGIEYGGIQVLNNIISSIKTFTNPNANPSKLEIGWRNFTSVLFAGEAKVLDDAKDRKLDFGMTQDEVAKVYPGLIPTSAEAARICAEINGEVVVTPKKAPSPSKASGQKQKKPSTLPTGEIVSDGVPETDDDLVNQFNV
jgi:hypothetical protein